jgi:hypothetical protein
MVITPPHPFPLFFSIFFPHLRAYPLVVISARGQSHTPTHPLTPTGISNSCNGIWNWLLTDKHNKLFGEGGLGGCKGCPWTTIWSLYCSTPTSSKIGNSKGMEVNIWMGWMKLMMSIEAKLMPKEISLECAPLPPHPPFCEALSYSESYLKS